MTDARTCEVGVALAQRFGFGNAELQKKNKKQKKNGTLVDNVFIL
jgi:hypothetical protein